MNLNQYFIKGKRIFSSKKIKLSKNKQLTISLAILVLIIYSPIAFGQYSQLNKGIVKEEKIAEKSEEPSPEPTPTSSPTVTETQNPTTKNNQATPKPTTTPTRTSGSKKVPTAPQTSTTTRQTATSDDNQSNSSHDVATPAPQPSGILGLINQSRLENGLNSLSYNSSLNSAAKAKSQDMQEKNYFSHTSPEGKSDFDFLRDVGYIFKSAGSNIAKGSFSESSVFNAWMNSSGHRANILNSNAREFGYGVSGQYYTMFVGAR